MLRIALQNKGRLNEDSVSLLSDAGISISDSKRKFLTRASNFPMEILYLRDDDIPQTVAEGVADIGIVGLNEVEEKQADVRVVQKLGFGGCRISLAIPKNDDYQGLEYFQGKRIATSYPKILKRFFDKNGIKADIVTITGSVEIAPAAGMSDAIFDIVSSGGTLVSNGLKEVEKIFFSEAVLIANKNLDAQKLEILDEFLFRFQAIENGRGMKYLLMNLPKESMEKALQILPAMRSPTVMPLAADGWCSMHSAVKESEMWDKIRQLKAIGAEGILILSLDKIVM